MYVVLAQWQDSEWPDVVGPFASLEAAEGGAKTLKANNFETSIQWLFEPDGIDSFVTETARED
jgi:hypothetical protein